MDSGREESGEGKGRKGKRMLLNFGKHDAAIKNDNRAGLRS